MERTIEVGGLLRTYLIHVPPSLPVDKPAPLVCVFHGGGGDAEGTERLTHFSSLADKEGFLVVYPEGVDKHWNDGRDGPATKKDKDIDDGAFIAALLDALEKEFKINPKRVYATGISNGGIFSHYLGATLADRFAAIAPVVGGLADPFHEKFAPKKPVSVLVMQGTKDPIVPYEGGEIKPGRRGKIIATDDAIQKWVKHNECAAKPVEDDLPDKDPDDGCTVKRFTHGKGKDGTEVVFYKIEGGGHTWPGGTQYLPERVIGKVCRDFDATAVIWEFFKAHPKL
jgi:polyhydroxybutyrate depolymerase